MSHWRLAAAMALTLLLASGSAYAQQASPPAPALPEPQPAEPMPPPKQPGERASPSPLQPGDPFGEEVQLPARTVVYLKGQTNWDVAFDTLVESFKSLNDYLAKQGLKAAGPALTIYTEADSTGFHFRAAVPVTEAPKETPKGDLGVGPAPAGRALKFVHRGTYDAMDTTYEAITNYLDEKQLDAQDLFIEEYVTDPVTTAQDKLVVNVYVPLK